MLKLLSGKKVFLLLVNDYSRLKWVAQLRSKDEAAEAVKCLRAGAESDSGKKMGCLRRAMSSPPTTSTTTASRRECGASSLHRTCHSRTAYWSAATSPSWQWRAACSKQKACWATFGEKLLPVQSICSTDH
jgi:hypothetical protein